MRKSEKNDRNMINPIGDERLTWYVHVKRMHTERLLSSNENDLTRKDKKKQKERYVGLRKNYGKMNLKYH